MSPPLPHELLEQTHRRIVDNKFFDHKSQEIYVTAKFLVNLFVIFVYRKIYY